MANITCTVPFDDLFRGFFVRPVHFKGAPAQTPSIKMDVQEQGDSYLVHAELPGVAICQLQRREGIDAVHVSRWTWDGRGRQREDDPDRRFPPQ